MLNPKSIKQMLKRQHWNFINEQWTVREIRKLIFSPLPPAGPACRSFWEKILIGSFSTEGRWQRDPRKGLVTRIINGTQQSLVTSSLRGSVHPEAFLSLVILKRTALGRGSLFNQKGSLGCLAHFPGWAIQSQSPSSWPGG